jgi:hypothetical protein
VEGSGRGLIEVLLGICLGGLSKDTNGLGIALIPAEIRTECLPITCL